MEPGAAVTAKPLDKARDGNTNQLNLFLYKTETNPAWRNMDNPVHVKPGERGHPPLALNLYYLVTAYGKNDEETLSHRLLGRAMSTLHDHPVLSREEIKSALSEADLDEQLERIRITSEPLSLDEMSKMWTSFQSQYRVSAAYQLSVVLIDSARASQAPLPVLTRGENDKGVQAQPNLIAPFPTLEEIILADEHPNARLGDTLTLRGHHLDGDSVTVNFANPRLDLPLALSSLAGASASELQVKIPDETDDPGAPADWVVGHYTVTVIISKAGEPDRTTNELYMAAAPLIESITPDPAVLDSEGIVNLTITVKPEVRPEQRAALLLGDREVLADDHPTQTDTIDFTVTDAPLGEHYVRVRVDGVDSLLIDRSVSPPVFDATQRVTIST